MADQALAGPLSRNAACCFVEMFPGPAIRALFFFQRVRPQLVRCATS